MESRLQDGRHAVALIGVLAAANLPTILFVPLSLATPPSHNAPGENALN